MTAAISGSPHRQAEALVDPSGLAAPGGQPVHDTEPASSENVFAGQLWHAAFAASGPNVAGGHSVQPTDPSALVLPLPQLAQSIAEAAPAVARAVPAGHAVQAGLPVASAYVPGEHAGQAVASASDVAVPLAHLAQLEPHTCEAEADASLYHPPPWSDPHA